MLRLFRLCLPSIAVVFAETVVSTERRASEVASQHAAFGLHRVESSVQLDLRVHEHKATDGLRNLRAHTQRSETATAFRAAKAQRRSASGLLSRSHQAEEEGQQQASALMEQQEQAPLYVPKIGLANITKPTAIPPPPPEMDPWKDMQPIDTAIGHYLISGFIEPPTITPPPSQAQLDLAFSCPALLTWPSQIQVTAPDPCGGKDGITSGKWFDGSGKILQMKWDTDCVDLDKTSSLESKVNPNPITKYTVPNGDLFGSSQDRDGFSGSAIELRDCGGALVYSIREKMYKLAGKADENSCKKFNSCDGIIYFQYFVYDKTGKTVAMTPYTLIFQESFDIISPAGATIASVSRTGWDPPILPPDCSNAPKRIWNIKFAPTPPGIWAVATNQWPIAEMVTMLSRRDMLRQPDGRVVASSCEIAKTTGEILIVGLGLLAFFCIPFIIFLVCSGPFHTALHEAESWLFPKRMGKPMKYGN